MINKFLGQIKHAPPNLLDSWSGPKSLDHSKDFQCDLSQTSLFTVFFLETSLFFSLGSKYASAGSVLQCKLTPMPKSHFVQKSSHVVFSRNIFLIFLDALKQGSKTSLKLRATSKALSKTKNYLFDTDFPNNVITISSGTYSSRHSFYYCPYTRLQCN